MKKTFFTFAAVALFAGSVAAQTVNYSHWSLGLKGGIDYYRVEQAQVPGFQRAAGLKGYLDDTSWDGALQLEYSVNPLFGIGLEAGYYDYTRHDHTASTIDATLYGSVSISNLVSPTRKGFWKKTNFYGNFGLGVGSYRWENPYSPIMNANGKGDGISPLITSGVSMDYNFGRVVALILEGQYRCYLTNSMGGTNADLGNDDAFLLSAGLRFKFGALSKTHTRNATVKEYFTELYAPQAAPAVDENLKKEVDALKKEVKALNKEVDGVKEQLKPIRNDIDELERQLKALTDKAAANADNDKITAAFDNIAFAFNSSKVDAKSKTLLDKIANAIKSANAKSVKVIGYTDEIGSEAYNVALSKDRAESVKKYLVEKGVPAASVTTDGKGKTKQFGANSSNRCVVFEITK